MITINRYDFGKQYANLSLHHHYDVPSWTATIALAQVWMRVLVATITCVIHAMAYMCPK